MSKGKILPPEEVLQSAIQAHLKGRQEDADRLYRTYLRWRPNDPTASINRSIILKKRGKAQEAISLLKECFEAHPSNDAIAVQLADLLSESRDYQEAIPIYSAAVSLAPRDGGLLNRAAITCILAERFEDALEFSESAIALNSQDVTAILQRGKALRGLRRMQESIDLYNGLLSREPALVEAWAMRADSRLQMGDLVGAESDYAHAIALDNSRATVWNNYGQVLRENNKRPEALFAFERAIELQNDYGLALLNRAFLHADAGHYAEAVIGIQRGAALCPDFPNLKGAILHYKLQVCDWSGYEEHIAGIQEGVEQGERVDSPWWFFGHTGNPRLQLKTSEIYTNTFINNVQHIVRIESLYRHEKIRVAYISSDFRMHAVSHLISGLFGRHNRDRFDIFGYALGPYTEDPMRKILESHFDCFFDVHKYNEFDVCAHMRENEIDILVDLNGYTAHCRPGIIARRPAPIQVNFLGFAGTMGAPFIDYIIGDKWVTPNGVEGHFSEKIVRMPNSYFVNNIDRPISCRLPKRVEVGLPENGFVFCCFNAFFKFTPDIFDVWMKLLAKVDGSVLWLKSASETVRENLSREAEARGISASRLIYAEQENDQSKHLARHRLADLFLDTPVYNAHTTGGDALWAGLPMITVAGEGFASRVGASLLDAVGLSELITFNLADYEALALRLARSPGLLEEVRERLRQSVKTSKLFDTDRFARNLERGFEIMVGRYEQGLPPESFDIPSA